MADPSLIDHVLVAVAHGGWVTRSEWYALLSHGLARVRLELSPALFETIDHLSAVVSSPTLD